MYSILSHLLLITIFVYGSSQKSGTWSEEGECDLVNEDCRRRVSQSGLDNQPPTFTNNNSNRDNRGRCNYKQLWLIPGSADTSCSKPSVDEHISIDVSSVTITPKVINLPGCFKIAFDLVVKDSIIQVPPSFFGRAEYQWLNLPEFSRLSCQNATNDGCGGYGNGCYYCDICSQLTKIDDIEMKDRARQVVDQFKGLKCPQEPGRFRLEKQLCFNDWKIFDEDNDCQIDFLQNAGKELGNYKSAFEALQQLGFGTLIAKFSLAYNATAAQYNKKVTKEQEIAEVWESELEKRRPTWDVGNGHFEKFRDWYIQYQKDLWHKNKYLPWLVYTNQMACLSVSFDVCDKEPTPVGKGSFGGFNAGQAQPSHRCI